ncbi:MAG: TAXI family TRAP transporter solute-binding subunit [Spirochaetaceae bacterium]|jgi:TRAP transporter TAXI family solute receptor|nr:TAXI family TRAP transporter solute-binding subunit [Spirochaetaceae bacterium]
MKNIIVVSVIMMAVSTAVFAKGSTQQQQQIRMATGGNTGTYYAYGSAVGQILQEKIKIPITIQSTGASKANIQLIAAGEVELAIVQNDVMDYAYRGTELFTGEQIQAFSSLAALYAEVCQVVAGSSGITSIAELKGKRVSVGDAGSGVEFNAKQILAVYGITFAEIDKQNLSFAASADALRDGKIDAFFCTAGAPTTAVVDLAIGKDIVLLEIDDAHAAQLMKDYPFYTKYPIPAGSYRGVTKDVQTVAVKATFIVSNKVSEETVYLLTKNLIESQKDIQNAHAKGAELSAAYAVSGISVPFHAGAARYFKEIGAIQ